MKTNRNFSLLIVLVLLGVLLAGCGSKPADSSSTLSSGQNGGFDVDVDGNDSSAVSSTASGGIDLHGRVIKINLINAIKGTPAEETPEGKAKLAWWKKIEEKYNCKFTEIAMGSESAGNTTITTSVLSGKPIVDLWFQNAAAEIFPHFKANLLQNLSELGVFDFNSASSPYKANQEIFKFNGAYYGVVPATNMAVDPHYSYVIYFNNDLLKKYGISDDLYALQDSGQWTWDKFAEIADKFNSNCHDANVTACFDDGSMLYQCLLYTRGVDWIKNTNGSLSFNGNDKLCQEALTYYQKLVSAGTVKLGPSGDNFGLATYTMNGLTGTGGKYSFVAGQAAFAIFPQLGMEWQINKNDATSDVVKKNYGILMLPKVKSSDSYTITSSISGQGGYSIPYGVKKPNEVAIILDQVQRQPFDVTQYQTSFMANNVEPWLNNATGDKSRAVAQLLLDMAKSGKGFMSYNGLAGYSTPNLMTDSDGWSKHVYNIATGKEAMGSVLTSITAKYNKIISEISSQR